MPNEIKSSVGLQNTRHPSDNQARLSAPGYQTGHCRRPSLNPESVGDAWSLWFQVTSFDSGIQCMFGHGAVRGPLSTGNRHQFRWAHSASECVTENNPYEKNCSKIQLFIHTSKTH